MCGSKAWVDWLPSPLLPYIISCLFLLFLLLFVVSLANNSKIQL